MSEMVFDGPEKKRNGHSPNSEEKKEGARRQGRRDEHYGGFSLNQRNLNARHTHTQRKNSPPSSFYANKPLGIIHHTGQQQQQRKKEARSRTKRSSLAGLDITIHTFDTEDLKKDTVSHSHTPHTHTYMVTIMPEPEMQNTHQNGHDRDMHGPDEQEEPEGPRMTRLRRILEKSLQETVKACNYNAVQECFPQVAASTPQELRDAHEKVCQFLDVEVNVSAAFAPEVRRKQRGKCNRLT